MDLRDIRSLYYMDETCGSNETVVDNLRLATKDAPRPPNLVEPFDLLGADQGWKEQVKRVPPLPKRDIPRETGPVKALGPVTLPEVDWGQKCPRNGAFGECGDAGTANVRAVAAYDNRRIAVVLGDDWILASFDGGTTWGGLDGQSAKATPCPRTHGHAGMGAGLYSGDLYVMARHMCGGGGGISRLDVTPIVFRGDRWEIGPTVLLDHHSRHCPNDFPIFFQQASGRVWGFWDAGCIDSSARHAHFARYSDDGGIAWRSPGAYPLQLAYVPGSLAAPFVDGVAAFGNDAWQRFDGTNFVAGVAFPRGRLDCVSAAGTTGGILAAAFVPFKKRTALTVYRLAGARWETDPLDDGQAGEIGSVSLTACGERIACFWSRTEKRDGRSDYAILGRIWNAAAGWSPAFEIARETDPIHRIVTPVVSPPDYAPVFWDRLVKTQTKWRDAYPWVRFARVPVDGTWKSAAEAAARR
jgi:hypothetical protein